MKLTRKIILVLAIFLGSSEIKAQYNILTDFGSPSTCDTMTQGPFCVWWDNSYASPPLVSRLLDSLNNYRNICVNTFNLPDPVNIANGNYINVYLHQPGDLFPTFFGNFVDTDSYGNLFITIPKVKYWDNRNTLDLAFRLFQSGHNSPGFRYPFDAKWFHEASANWFVTSYYPNYSLTFDKFETLKKLPQLPLWYGTYNRPSQHPNNWQRENRQHALGHFLYYLTRVKAVPGTTITNGYTAGTSLLPQEYYATTIGISYFRDYFKQWIRDIVVGSLLLNHSQKTTAINEWNTNADTTDNFQYASQHPITETGGWLRPNDSAVTGAWSFNIHKFRNYVQGLYTFRIKGDLLSSESDTSYFEGFIIVKTASGSTKTYPMNILNKQESSITIELLKKDAEIQFVVASMPEIYKGVENLFSYQIYVHKGSLSNEPVVKKTSNLSLYPNPAQKLTSIKISKPAEYNIPIELTDLTGKLIIENCLKKGETEIQIPVTELQAGTYLVNARFKTHVYTQKLSVY